MKSNRDLGRDMETLFLLLHATLMNFTVPNTNQRNFETMG